MYKKRILHIINVFISDEEIHFDFPEERSDLRAKRIGYAGDAVTGRRRLIVDKVIAVWPDIGSAGVCPIIDHISEELKDDLLNPGNCLLPEAEWPEETPHSKVYVDPDEWYSICKAAFARGMMAPVDESKKKLRTGQGA